ncbi:RagB/SusD family nutrient uptake outer membrane protein [Niabella ginsengisoli]|uniref:RagB/SusD family nutrient uptake outer membrane protein n=1 Tax=Niabella ginsengisoli TaxID=522298 RepID=A0ABS9SG45_9BACT|nr:RagB/SusD family nutrient uptake outer membrane protein [Niabella ginsengisoli]MCH5597291.1 RagB/SusD family nutrient uptake outer membrane protein [Niabella ginsengisoli]
MVKENTELGWGRGYIADLANNNIRRFVDLNYSGNNWRTIFNHVRFTQWDRYYRVIAAANIAVDRIGDVPDPALTGELKAAYTGEAVFIRNLAYFFMVRQFGDVAYYTEPYFAKPLKRAPMADVLRGCIADMKEYYKGMPWTYDDPFYVGIRGMRGAAIALMMEMNLWLAGFDIPNSQLYYNDVIELANEARNENGGAYQLLPIERYIEIFKGRSSENLFGIPQNRNYGERFGWSDFFDQVKYDPLNPNTASIPYMSYTGDFMRALYPEGEADQRLQLWFNPATAYNANRTFQMKKFLVTADPNSIDFNDRNDATQCVYRYPDIF